jgi:hypothetical protein
VLRFFFDTFFMERYVYAQSKAPKLAGGHWAGAVHGQRAFINGLESPQKCQLDVYAKVVHLVLSAAV